VKTFYAEDILHWSRPKLWSRLEDWEPINLKFIDGDIVTTFHQTIISWYFWEYHRRYPEIELRVENHVFDERMSPGLQNKLQKRAADQILAIYPEDLQKTFEIHAWTTQELHNDIVTIGEDYQDTLDSLDLLQIYRHPKLREILANLSEDKRAISKMYQEYQKVLETDPAFRFNKFSNTLRNKQAKVGQAMQVVAIIGYRTEINQNIFRTMIPVGFSVGAKRLSWSVMDRCSASRAELATDEPVKRTEYYNRELQLVTYVLKGVATTDCGSRETIPWEVTSDDLHHVLPGKYYYDANGELRMIRAKGEEWVHPDTHLIGKTIRLRTPSLCHHPDDGVVCKYCLCENAERIQKGTNPGFALTVTQNEQVSQDVISTKHHLASAIAEVFQIEEHLQRYISNAADSLEIALAEPMWAKRLKVRLDLRDIPRLSDITLLDQVTESDAARISAVKTIVLVIDNGDKKPTEMVIPVSRGSYRPYMSREFIKYMKDFGFNLANKYIEVDLMHWPDADTLLKFPERSGSTLELMEELKSEIFMSSKEGKLKIKADLQDPEILAMCIKDTSDMTNRKFSVNLGIVELILYCMMARDPKNGDFRLPKKGTGRHFVPQAKIMNGRSLSAKVAYERQYEMIADPKAYIHTARPNHEFDHLLLNVKARGGMS